MLRASLFILALAAAPASAQVLEGGPLPLPAEWASALAAIPDAPAWLDAGAAQALIPHLEGISTPAEFAAQPELRLRRLEAARLALVRAEFERAAAASPQRRAEAGLAAARMMAIRLGFPSDGPYLAVAPVQPLPGPAAASPADGAAAPARVRIFPEPIPNRPMMWALGLVNRWFLLKGLPILRNIPLVRDLPFVHGYFWVRNTVIPQADRERLAKAVNPRTAAFLGPQHPEFATDWMIDKEISTFVAPNMGSWADRGIVNGAPGFWRRNNLISNDGGEKAKDYSVRWALAGHGVLLHPEGTVFWTGDKIHPLFPGIAQMAADAAARAAEAGSNRPVYIVPLVWKLQYLRDVSGRIHREMSILERGLGLASGEGLSVAERFKKLQESILAQRMARFGFVPRPGDFFARQEAFQSWLLKDLETRYESDSAAPVEQRIAKLGRAIRTMLRTATDAERDALKRDIKLADEARRLGEFSREVYGTARLTQEQLFESLKRGRDRLLNRNWKDKLANLLPRPFGPRALHIGVPEPILVQPGDDEKELLQRARAGMQSRLDQINRKIAPDTSRFSHPNPFAP